MGLVKNRIRRKTVVARRHKTPVCLPYAPLRGNIMANVLPRRAGQLHEQR